ncbi:hypothetical protein OE88DRAFT_1733653 [Heliocybe sulcata]|uniref:Synaptobrevin n=1 Tax=Heliocybe sulcata TaxID=5364 RepID=A0A5C3N8Y2_9AGAM|nr:hypothetical protein OE88DRAFT_1733653 [Heliocybe sulcata]
MSFQSAEQSRHDRINLVRLVKKLDQSVKHDFEERNVQDVERSGQRELYVKAQGTMQKVKYAQRLLRNPEVESELQLQRMYEDFRSTLERLQSVVERTLKVLEPRPIHPEPMLPTLPKPKTTPQYPTNTAENPAETPAEAPRSPDEAIESLPTSDLLLSPSDTLPRMPEQSRASLIPSPLPQPTMPGLPTSSTVPLQSSNLLQEELSAQLAQMASQLKANAVHFSSTLAKDEALVQDAQEKLETNYDEMKRERVRVRDFRGKSGGTTWLVVCSVIVVLISFVVMVFIIRWTR